MKNGKTCFGVIIGTRAYFNSELAKDVRKQLLKTLEEGGYEYVILPEDATPTGSSSIETREDGLKVSKQFRAHRDEIDGIIFNYRKRPVIGHFRDADKDTPIWAIFEVMTLGNFGAFYDCLDKRVKTAIVRDLGMPTNLESELRLKDIIFALKDFRNAIAHNGVIVDVRFKSGSINTGVAQLLKQETGVGKIDFTDITDYVILLIYLMRKMGFTKTECKQLVAGYEAILEKYRAELPFNIYSKLIKTSAHGKLTALQQFVSNG